MESKKISDYQRKKNTIIFTIVTGLLNVVFMLALMVAMLLIFIVVTYKILGCQSSLPAQIAMPVIMIAGFALDFILSVRLIRLAIIKFNLADKILKTTYPNRTKAKMPIICKLKFSFLGAFGKSFASMIKCIRRSA